ncbi:MAG: EAL domain-containing protein [Lachnospiraceae bacterium]|nr:EAL domain-containing protein [Lachnospiraceae bacterium]
MGSEAAFGIASVIITILIVFYFIKLNKVYNFQSGLFLVLVIDNGITSLSQVVTWSFRRSWPACPVWIYELSSYVYFITHLLMVGFLFLYLFSTIKIWREITVWVRAAILIPISIGMLIVLSNPFTHLIYSYSKDGVYHREAGIITTYLTFIYYFSLMVFTLIWYRKSFSIRRHRQIRLILGLGLMSVLVQLFLPDVKIEVCTIALCGFIMFLFVQNPMEQIDSEVGVFSRQAFLERLKYNMLSRKRFDLIELMLPDFREQTVVLSNDEKTVLLRQIAEFISSVLSNGNVYHTEQTIFVLEVIRPEAREVGGMIRRIKTRFEEPWEVAGKKIQLAGRMLRLILPTEAQDDQLVLGVMSRFEKSTPESRVMMASDFDLQTINRNQKITGALARAMEKKHFEMRYTPVYSPGLERIVAAEVSVRFFDDELGYVYDDEIYSFAERSGHAVQLGELIFERSCEFIEKNDLKAHGLSFLGMHVHPAMCLQYGLMDKLKDIAHAHHVDPHMLCLQISEYTVSKASKGFKENLAKLSGDGLRFCLEDYGSGFTSITSIFELPFSVLKVNKSVMQATMFNEKARITMDSTLAMARELSMMTMVEGIDEEAHFKLISDMACDLAKGNYFFEQLDEEEFLRVLRMSEEKDRKEGGNSAL